MRRHLSFTLLILIGVTPICGQLQDQLKSGDLLFQDLDCGPMCEAIEAVTEGAQGRDFSHVGIVFKFSDTDWKVAEAISRGVVWTPLDSFLLRSFRDSSYNVVHARIPNLTSEDLSVILNFIDQNIGQTYDEYFIYDNDMYYCSELLYDAFQTIDTNLFELAPMTFKSNDSAYFPVWIEYYKKLKTEIPEGKLGINPGIMSRSPSVEILQSY